MQAQCIDFLDLFDGQVQYVVPRWQRRYRWGDLDIVRLVEDLIAVASQDEMTTHYGGTLLTFPEPGPAGVVKKIRVVDGQQRLTTVSILLACIAEKLGSDGNCDDWTAAIIRNDRLTNPGKSRENIRKLKLQDGDEDEYRNGLEGSPKGAGAVTQAWKIIRRLVDKHDVSELLTGLRSLRVVSIGVENEDPQQIFESLNATGHPLTESEKVKNWLLMGLPDEKQQFLHDKYWLQIENDLGAKLTTEPIDLFLRDFLRWQTGEIHGIDQTYEILRRWAVRNNKSADQPTLFREFAQFATLYGKITGTAGRHSSSEIEAELRYLRSVGIDTHRPFTLRLLHDYSNFRETSKAADKELKSTLASIGTWITRLWLADRRPAGMNKAFAELARDIGPQSIDLYSEYWLNRIRRHRNTRVGIPDDEEVREGIRNRKAYGGSATRTSFAILYSLAKADHTRETPAPDELTVEHVMPQKLTDEWKKSLGGDAAEIHGRYRDQLANLTLSGKNPEMGASAFEKKRQFYEDSTIAITRRLADEEEWNVDALERRADYLCRRALKQWPWVYDGVSGHGTRNRSSSIKWRIEQEQWNMENTAVRMVLNVAAELLTRSPEHAQRLSGDAVSTNIHLSTHYPPDSKVGGIAYASYSRARRVCPVSI